MIRAGVFIGVDRTGELQELHDAAAGAQRMYEWALAQGMTPETQVRLITDAGNGKVTAQQICDAIEQMVDGAGVDQLIVYFAGHGVNISRGEQWLLSGAPRRTSEAVNVSGSVELARYCGIGHVVLISDACRVAPEGIQAQSVKGVDIFPNDGTGDKAKPVDVFYACLLGRTAAEVKDPQSAALNYSALYTDALLDALEGTRPELLKSENGGDEWPRVVKTWDLENYLEAEIPARVQALGLANKVNQSPDAIITSRESWLARITAPVARRRGPGGFAFAPPPAPVAPPPSMRDLSRELTTAASAGDRQAFGMRLERAKAAGIADFQQFAAMLEGIATPFGPDHFETKCGIKVRGARIVEVFAPRATPEPLGDEGEIVRMDRVAPPGTTALVVLDGGRCCLVPVIPDFIVALTFDAGELVDVACEPSANSWRGDAYRAQAEGVRALHAVAASASHHGRFRLDREEAGRVGRSMQIVKGLDPTLAVYAAYAYHDIEETERIAEMSGYLASDVGVTFFDLEMLGRRMTARGPRPEKVVLPFVPLLSQGWTLLRALRVSLHPALEGIEAHLRDSLWTLFDAPAIDPLKRALATREVR